MHCFLRPLRAEHVRALDADAGRAVTFTYADGAYPAMIARLRELGAPAQVIASYRPPPPDLEPACAIGQAWSGLHWMLTGSATEPGEPGAGWAILGGRAVGDDGGYGPPTILAADEVRVVARALAGLDEAALLARLDAAPIPDDVYLADWWRRPDGRAVLTEALPVLVACYERASASRHAMLRWLT